jgi:hypothetical protein
LKLAVPFTTVGLTGFEIAGSDAKQADTATAHKRAGVLSRNRAVREGFLSLIANS